CTGQRPAAHLVQVPGSCGCRAAGLAAGCRNRSAASLSRRSRVPINDRVFGTAVAPQPVPEIHPDDAVLVSIRLAVDGRPHADELGQHLLAALGIRTPAWPGGLPGPVE